MAWVITEPCVGEKHARCVAVCPEDCILTTDTADQYFIDPVRCTNCGLCDMTCPVAAIFPEEVIPIQWRHYIEKNKILASQSALGREVNKMPSLTVVAVTYSQE